MRYWTRLGLKSNNWYQKDKQMPGIDSYVNIEAGIGVVLLQSKEFQRLLGTPESRKDSSLGFFQREHWP